SEVIADQDRGAEDRLLGVLVDHRDPQRAAGDRAVGVHDAGAGLRAGAGGDDDVGPGRPAGGGHAVGREGAAARPPGDAGEVEHVAVAVARDRGHLQRRSDADVAGVRRHVARGDLRSRRRHRAPPVQADLAGAALRVVAAGGVEADALLADVVRRGGALAVGVRVAVGDALRVDAELVPFAVDERGAGSGTRVLRALCALAAGGQSGDRCDRKCREESVHLAVPSLSFRRAGSVREEHQAVNTEAVHYLLTLCAVRRSPFTLEIVLIFALILALPPQIELERSVQEAIAASCPGRKVSIDRDLTRASHHYAAAVSGGKAPLSGVAASFYASLESAEPAPVAGVARGGPPSRADPAGGGVFSRSW